MANRVTPIPHIRVVEQNRFHFWGSFRLFKTKKLFSKRNVEEDCTRSGLYRQVSIMIFCSKLFCLWPLKRDFRICLLQLVVSATAIAIWTYHSLSYAKNHIDVVLVAAARYILTIVRLFFCCLSVISTLYLYTSRRYSFLSFFRGMERLDSILRSIGCEVSYPKNISFIFHILLTFHLIYVQTNFFSRLSFLLEVQNQYRYCVFVVIHMFTVLLNAFSLRFRLLCSSAKKCDSNSRFRLHTLIKLHKSLCHQIRKLRKIYSFQIVMIFAVIITTYIWNVHRFSSMILRFEDEYAKKTVINLKSRTIMISLYTFWLWLMASAGENLKRSADNFYEELYSIILEDQSNILSKDLMLKTYLKVKPSAEYRLCKAINLDNRLIKSVLGITVSYIIVSIQLSIPCKCQFGIVQTSFNSS
ncbi:uncharacterized protein [Halyomorpha halys]|uniref:uncharacterized protein n=1 Tax=Halyomorpha halys TaxID=286706 RepID=UPI0006D4C88A|nr:uncharacterized protein LOC106686368 [Halyomorpha halys]KAE8573316.1 Gustatory receptor 196 [Halyomorpha halys]